MRKKSLTPDQNGQIWVNIGWKLTKSGKRSQAKISLGDSLKNAEPRLARLEPFWEDIEKKSKAPLWDEFTFKIVDGGSKRRRGAAEFGGAGLFKFFEGQQRVAARVSAPE